MCKTYCGGIIYSYVATRYTMTEVRLNLLYRWWLNRRQARLIINAYEVYEYRKFWQRAYYI